MGAESVGRQAPGLVNRSSAVDAVLAELRRAIVHGGLGPGQEVSVTELAGNMGVSHTPVREALRALSNEGLVSLRSQRRIMIAPLDVRDLRDIYRLRILIEGELAERSAPLYGEEELTRIRQLFDALAFQGTADDLAVHGQFHQALVLPAASPWDLRILETLWVASERHLRLLFAHFDPEDAQTLHRPLLEQAVNRDGPALRAALADHLNHGIEVLSSAHGRSAGG